MINFRTPIGFAKLYEKTLHKKKITSRDHLLEFVPVKLVLNLNRGSSSGHLFFLHTLMYLC